MEANKFIEKKFFNRHFFLEAINESNHPIDFIADLMEEWEQLRIHDVVGRSEQLSLCQCNKPVPDIIYGKTCTECCLEIDQKA